MGTLERIITNDGDGPHDLIEPNLGSGRRITPREIVNTHFAENADQVYPHFLFVTGLFQATGGKFSLSPESLLPILSNHRPVSTSPPHFSFFVDLLPNNRPELESDFGKTLLAGLRQSCETVGLEGSKEVFRMKSGQDKPLIILEEKADLEGANYLSLRLARDSGGIEQSSANSTGETIFNLNIKQRFFISNDGVLDWIHAGSADWITSEEEPYAYFTENALRILSQPMNIENEIYLTPRAFFRDMEFFLRKEVFPNPNPDFLQFPIYFTSPDHIEERYVRPYYYLDLALLGAKMIQLSVLANTDNAEAIADQTKNEFKDQMLMFQKPLFMIEFDSKFFDGEKLAFSPMEYLMYELVWQGFDIWPYIDEFTTSMVQSFKTDPKRFWDTVSALGIDHVLPIFQGMDETKKDEIKSKLKPDSELPILRRVFSLIPSLGPYYDHNPGKEKGYGQSDEYYTQITLALAAYSYDVGQEPVAAIAVHEGNITGARRNDTKKHHEKDYSRIFTDHSRHAEILLINSLGDGLKPGMKLYVSLAPCDQCTYHLRRNPNITEVNCSADSTMGDIQSLTDSNLSEKNMMNQLLLNHLL